MCVCVCVCVCVSWPDDVHMPREKPEKGGKKARTWRRQGVRHTFFFLEIFLAESGLNLDSDMAWFSLRELALCSY